MVRNNMLSLGDNWKTLAIVFMIATPLCFVFGYLIHVPATLPEFTPVIDGFIEDGWERADFKLAQYINLDESRDPDNVDGFNYVYMKTDEENLYLAVDMPSDLNGTTTNEFLGIFLNTMQREFGGIGGWFGETFEKYRDNGTEALVFDFEEDYIVPFIYDEDGIKSQYFNYIENSTGEEVLMTTGEYVPFYDVWDMTFYDDIQYIVINSTEFGYGMDIYDRICLNFSVHIADYFGIYDQEDLVSQLIDDLENMQINISAWIIMNSLETNRLHIENNGTYNDAPFNLMSFDHLFDVNKSAYEDGDLEFSILFENLTDSQDTFYVLCDWLNLQYNKSDSIDSVYGGTTIDDYILEYNFSSSMNSDEDHRMYEIQIPLTELENYNASGKLGLFVCGNIQIGDGYADFRDVQSYQFTGNNDDLYFMWFVIATTHDPDWSENYIIIDLSKFE